MGTATRTLTPGEKSHIDEALARLREHFSVWPSENGKEWYLVDFAYYEGCGHRHDCCIEVLRECAPLALGTTLVHDHAFEWCMIQEAAAWRFAVKHPAIAEPLDLYTLDANPILDPDHHDADTEPFDPGEGAHESIHAILRQIGQTVGYH